MSDYHLDNSDDNNYTWSNYAEGQPARNYYPTPLASGQGSPYPQTTHGSVYMGTSQEERREQGWDVEARAGSFDGDTRWQDDPSEEYTAAAADEQTTQDFENHRQYTDQYINSLEPPLGYRDDTGGNNDLSSSRRRARHRVRDVLNADYTGNGGSSSASRASGQNSSRRHESSQQHHHGHKSSKHAGKDNKKHSKH